MANEYGIRWTEVNRRDEIVSKEKIFKTEAARDKFAAKLNEKDGFVSIESWFN